MLLAHEHEGRREVVRYDLGTGDVDPIGLGEGTITEARVRPDGSVWYVFESSSQPPVAREWSHAGDAPLFTPRGDTAPAGVSYESLYYPNGDGDLVHAFLGEPEGEGPHPLLVYVHAGPDEHFGDTFDPYVQAWVDHGFAVLMPNWRGSTGYGKDWQDTLYGDPGRPELVDIKAGRDHCVQEGIADPDRVVLVGFSYGGYLALQGIGTQPDTWSAAIAAAPMADMAGTYRDQLPRIRELYSGLFAGTPEERGDLWRERSPITYVDQVGTPVLVIAGEYDKRCPKPQIDDYVAKLAEHGKEHRYIVYDADHPSLWPHKHADQIAPSIDFVADHLGTTRAQRPGE